MDKSEVPKNCSIVKKTKLKSIDMTTGQIVTEDVEQCVPLLESNVVAVYQIGKSVKAVFQPVSVAGGVDTHEVHKFNKESGWIDEDEEDKENRKKESKRTSISRTKRIINELVACNPWKYFVTITLSPKKWDRYTAGSKLKKAFNNNVKRWKRKNKEGKAKLPDYKYLFIPELHKDGAIHIHGFVSGIPKEDEVLFTSEEVDSDKPIPKEICEMVRNGVKVYHCLDWDKHFGFNTLTEVKDLDKAANYVTKYVTKALETHIFPTKYWHSRGLERAKNLGKFNIRESDREVFLCELYEMAVTTKNGKKMYYETDSSVINTSVPTANTKLLTAIAYINNSEHSTKEILDFISSLAEKDEIFTNEPKEEVSNEEDDSRRSTGN